MVQPLVVGVDCLPNGAYEVPERDMAASVLSGALEDAGLALDDVDGLYMPKPRPWTPQGFFSTFLTYWLGLELDRSLEVYTGGTSAGTAFRSAVTDVRDDQVDVAVVLAVERNSIVDTDRYFEYVLGIFDRQFQSPIGPSIPGVYAQSLQRYLHEYDVDRDSIAEITVKNRANAASNPDALFDDTVTAEEVVSSRPISDPLRLYECPAPTDGAAAVCLTGEDVATDATPAPVRVSGTGYHHAESHLIGARGRSLTALPAAERAVEEALADAGASVADLDVLEPYAPFPHIEAMLTEEIGLLEPGTGAVACREGKTARDGEIPVSPSGGCIGRGHPAMVTPLLNYVAAVRQIRGTAPVQVPGAETVLTTSEHGHVDGMNAAVFEEDP